jgi:hypothetical protein
MLREILTKALLSFVLTIFLKIYGIVFLIGYIIGVEFMQTCYRAFKDGYHWGNLYKKPLILRHYFKPKDTAIDILSYAVGIALAILLWRLLYVF